MNRSEIIHNNFIERVSQADLPSASPLDTTLSNSEIVDIFETQLMSRLLDIISRRMSSRKQSFYTIGSSGHEGNAIFGKVFETNDIAFLHYRSCALALQRSKKVSGSTSLYDTMLSFVASSEDPISGGRHKVIGSKELWIPPQTSTIASHLPKAMGAAHALGLYEKVQYENVGLNKDSIVLCNFGDASLNHSTAQGALNTAAWASYQLSPMPIVFICEDNGIGISTHTPKGWVEANFSQKPGLKYMSCNGLDILDTHRTALAAQRYTRRTRKPVFLHFKTVRLMGHAGSDIEATYHKNDEITAMEANDPLLHSASLILNKKIMSADNICQLYKALETKITRISEAAISRPKLTSASHVMDSIWPPHRTDIIKTLARPEKREKLFKKDKRHLDKPVSLSKHINLALADIMLQHSNTVVFGEDVAVKGGVYGVTQGLHDKFGPARVTNTLLDEQSILGLAIGLGHCGFLPIPEIQYLAYFHNAEDQIRGEAASLSFFSQGLYTNPMVVRIAGFAYQKGFGGHFHNDNSFTVFRDIPGIIVATPSNGQDAAQILRICVEMAQREQKVVVIIEPIALYNTADLHEAGDNLWVSQYQAPSEENAFNYGDVNVVGDSKELCILSYANGFYLSNQAALKLQQDHGIKVRLVDMRWLQPLPEKAILEAISDCESVLVVDECRRSGSISEAIMTMLQEQQCPQTIKRINAEDSFIPLGSAAYEVLLGVDDIVNAAVSLHQQRTTSNSDEKNSNMSSKKLASNKNRRVAS